MLLILPQNICPTTYSKVTYIMPAFLLALMQNQNSHPMLLVFLPFKLLENFIVSRLIERQDIQQAEMARTSVFIANSPVLPEPFLSKILLGALRNDLKAGLLYSSTSHLMLFQSWATQKALRTILEQDNVPFLIVLHFILTNRRDRHISAQFPLFELTEIPEKLSKADDSGDLSFAYKVTRRLRAPGVSPYARPALMYSALLGTIERSEGELYQLSDESINIFSKLLAVSCVPHVSC